MKKSKYVGSNGLAFSEDLDMTMLSVYAKEGWILDKFGLFGYKLKKGNPQDIQYFLDYTNKVDEDYYSYFEAAGWRHVCSIGNNIHIFSAPEGKEPIYTDKITNIEKYDNQYRQLGKTALPSLIIFILFFSLSMMAKYSYIPRNIGNICIVLMIISLVPLVFSGLPCISHYFRVKELKKPIYTGKITNTEKYQRNYRRLVKISLSLIILFVLFFSISMLARYSWISMNIGNISRILMIISALILVVIICVLSWMSYCFRINK